MVGQPDRAHSSFADLAKEAKAVGHDGPGLHGRRRNRVSRNRYLERHTKLHECFPSASGGFALVGQSFQVPHLGFIVNTFSSAVKSIWSDHCQFGSNERDCAAGTYPIASAHEKDWHPQ